MLSRLEFALKQRFILFLAVHWSQMSSAQNIDLEIIEPDQLSPCPNKQVIFECRISVGTTSLIWSFPTSEIILFGFSIASANGTTLSTNDGKFTATLTGKSESSSGDMFLNSTLQVQPPLNALNGSVLRCNGGSIGNLVETSITITTSGFPDAPIHLLHKMSANTESSATIQWSSGDSGITSYLVRVDAQMVTVHNPSNATVLTYVVSWLKYNTYYSVEVMTVDKCGLESEPTTVIVNISARVPPKPSTVSVELSCNTPVKDGWPVFIAWEYGAKEEGVVYPGEVEIALQFDPESEGCSNLTENQSNCTAMIREDDMFTITLTLSNDVGSSTPVVVNSIPAQVKARLNSSEQFSVFPSINELCDIEMNYSVTLFFGVTDAHSDHCQLRQNFKSSASVGTPQIFIANTWILSQSEIQKYCIIATLEKDAGELRGLEENCESDGLLLQVIPLTMVVSLSVGVTIGLWLGYCVWRRGQSCRMDQKPNGDKAVAAIYDEVGPPSIPVHENGAYHY